MEELKLNEHFSWTLGQPVVESSGMGHGFDLGLQTCGIQHKETVKLQQIHANTLYRLQTGAYWCFEVCIVDQKSGNSLHEWTEGPTAVPTGIELGFL